MVPLRPSDLIDLLRNSQVPRQELKQIYSQMPDTACRRRAFCCSLLPEMTLIEALEALEQLSTFPPARRKVVTQKLIGYFFSNPVEITSCPFLEHGNCLIYPSRFFGCRAYGLWTKEHYQQMTRHDRLMKRQVIQLWNNLGVALPEKVIGHQANYCSAVETLGPKKISDRDLLQTAARIEGCSQKLNPWHLNFQKHYFQDLSFLTAGFYFDLSEVVRLKFTLVRDLLQTGNRSPLERLIAGVPDLFGFLAGEGTRLTAD